MLNSRGLSVTGCRSGVDLPESLVYVWVPREVVVNEQAGGRSRAQTIPRCATPATGDLRRLNDAVMDGSVQERVVATT